MSLTDAAIEADSGFARAHSLRAALLLSRAFFSKSDKRFAEDMHGALASANRALDLAPKLGEPYFILGVGALMQGRMDAADKAFQKAITLAPNNAEGRNWYGTFLLDAGYLERAWSEKQRAVELDPLSPIIFWQVAFAALAVNHPDAVQEFAVKSTENGWTGWQPEAIQGGVALQRQQFTEAQAHYSRAFPGEAEHIAQAFAAIRNRSIDAPTRQLLDGLSPYGPPGLARWHVELWAGDLDAAYATAWSGIDSASPEMSEFPGRLLVSDWWFPTAADFRKDPRFAELMRTVGLLDFWQQNGWPDLCQPSGNSLRCQ